MKKIQIFAICFCVLYLALAWYSTTYVNESSFNWLVAKLITLGLMLVTSAFFQYGNRRESLASPIFGVFVAIFVIGHQYYQDITRYQRAVCQDRFGPVFNSQRRQSGVPEIPADWHMSNRGHMLVDWVAKDSTGHFHKSISIYSNCIISHEIDDYKLKSVNGLNRLVSINTTYANGNGVHDSLFYSYQLGDSTQFISRRQADSIFALEKVKKDY